MGTRSPERVVHTTFRPGRPPVRVAGPAAQRRRERTATPAATAPVAAPPTAPTTQPGPGRLAAGAVVADPPALLAGLRPQLGVRVDGARRRRPASSIGRSLKESEYAEQRARSSPSRAASALTASRLRRAVQQVADQPAGVDAVLVLGDRAQGAGQAEPPGDDRGDLDRRRGHQPHPLALVEVELGEGAGAGPDPVRHRLVEDLLAELLELGDGVPGDEAERGVAGVGDVVGVLDADDPEVGLLPGGAEDVAGGEELAPVQARARGGRCWRPASRCCRRRRTPPPSGPPGCPGRSRPPPRTPPPRPRASSAAAGSAGVGAGRRAGSHGQRRPRGTASRPAVRCRVEGSRTCLSSTTSPTSSPTRLRSARTRSRSSTRTGARLTWAQLEDEVGRMPPAWARPASWPASGSCSRCPTGSSS